MTLVIRAPSARRSKAGIAKAAAIIREGGVVVFPTETVYGIGANAFDEQACRNIYRIKGRASDNPLIVHVSSMEMADSVGVIPKRYRAALQEIWPAPLTVVVKAKALLPKVVTGGLPTVAMRMPDSAVALELIRQSGTPIAAPSANISKKPSSTSAQHALGYFRGKVGAIINKSKLI